ncbi:MAG: hypothetical protein ACFCUR_17670 [Rhodomicrobiaceae bacterium]
MSGLQQDASRGLMAFWADIPEDNLLDFQKWHNCEHMPERVSIPGFNRGCRYRGWDGRSHFLMFYETATADVLGSEAYLSALNAPTPWTRRALQYFRNPVRNIYELIGGAGQEGALVAPYIASLRFNVDESIEAASAERLRAISEMDGVARARLYRVEEAVSGIMTSERKIYGGGPGAQRYLALVECAASPDDMQDLEKLAADRLFPSDAPQAENLFFGDYWLEMTYEKR